MELDNTTKDYFLKENKSETTSKGVPIILISSQSAHQLTKDLNIRRESIFEDDKSCSINYENLYLNTEYNIPPSIGNLNDGINTIENLNFEENSSQNITNIYYNNTEENINNAVAMSLQNHSNNGNDLLNNINSNNILLNDHLNHMAIPGQIIRNNDNIDVNNENHNIPNPNFIMNTEDSQNNADSKLCHICEVTPIDFFFICGNGSCIECLYSHIQSILEKYKQKVFSQKIKFVCVSSCKCIIEDGVYEKFIQENSNLKELHNEVLFKMHLAKTKDIISCPKSSCSNSGFFRGNSACFECNSCGTKIPNPNDIFSADFFSKLIDNMKFSNFKSHMLKIFTTKYCNKCNSPIEKADGCKHIECNRCEYGFCWKCTGDWSNHSQTACMGIFSNPFDDNDRPDFFFMICFYLTVITVLKLISSLYVLFKLFYFFMAILFVIGIILNILFTAGMIDLLIKYRIKTIIIPTLLFAILEGFLYYFQLHPLSEKFYFWLQIISNTLVGVVMGIIYLRKRR